MPIVVDPSYVPPAASDTVGSPDGLLQVRVDTTNAGVLLRADYSAVSSRPLMVRFYRGDGTLVRSGDPAWAPGGIAHAYDHEAPIGTPAGYYVVPVLADGTDGAQSERVTVELAWTGDTSSVWIKNPSRPDLSMFARAATFEEQARPLRTTFTDVPGVRLGISTSLVTGGLTGTLTIKTDTVEEYEAMLALFDGSVLLIQAHPTLGGVPTMYARPSGDLVSLRRAETGYGWGMRDWPVQLTESRRPATLDAPLRIPGLSWAAVASHYPTWQELASRVASWDDLIWGGLGDVEMQYDVLDGGSPTGVPTGVIDLGGP